MNSGRNPSNSRNVMETCKPSATLHRRRLLQGFGALSIASLAGCTNVLGGSNNRGSGQKLRQLDPLAPTPHDQNPG